VNDVCTIAVELIKSQKDVHTVNKMTNKYWQGKCTVQKAKS